MAQNIPTTQLDSILLKGDDGSLIGKFNASVIYQRPMAVFMARNIARTLQAATNIQGGTAIYYIAQRNITKNYDGTQSPDLSSNRAVRILINFRKTISYTVETIDLQQLGARWTEGEGNNTVANTFMTNLVQGNMLSTIAYLSAKITQARINVTENLPLQQFDLPLFTSDTTKNDFYFPSETSQLQSYLQTTIIIPINLIIAKLESLISLEFIGVERSSIEIEVSPLLYALLSQSLVTVGSDKGFEQLINYDFVMIGGVRYTKNNLLGTNYAVGRIDKEEGFDFSDTHILIYHNRALAYPIVPTKLYNTIQPNSANPNFITKWSIPGKVDVVVNGVTTKKDQNLALYPRLFLRGNITHRPASFNKKK